MKNFDDIKLYKEFETTKTYRLLLQEWENLEKYGVIDNFKNLANNKAEKYSSIYYSDFELHRWVKIACEIFPTLENDTLKNNIETKINIYIELIRKIQRNDGYINTFFQKNNPNSILTNMNFGHELYVLGEFILAAISHYKEFNTYALLNSAQSVANYIKKVVAEDENICSVKANIELALIKLSQITEDKSYERTANILLERRGVTKTKNRVIKDYFNIKQKVNKTKNSKMPNIYEHLIFKESANIKLSSLITLKSGKHYQINRNFLNQKKILGNSANYLKLLLSYLEADEKNIKFVSEKWDDITLHYMYISGGIGSRALTEGFEKKYKLYNITAFANTESANLFIKLSQKLFQKTRLPKYQDAIEWIYFNNILPSISDNKKDFFYRNILESNESIVRKSQLKLPYSINPITEATINYFKNSIYTDNENSEIFLNNLYTTKINLEEQKLTIDIKNKFPINFFSEVTITKRTKKDTTVYIRVPGWTEGYKITLNDEELECMPMLKFDLKTKVPHFYNAQYYPVTLSKRGKNIIKIEFMDTIKITHGYKKEKDTYKKVAISRGPFLYCLEDKDNKDLDFYGIDIDTNQKTNFEKSYDFVNTILIKAKSSKGDEFRLVPYYLWGNRGLSKMKVWIDDSNFKS